MQDPSGPARVKIPGQRPGLAPSVVDGIHFEANYFSLRQRIWNTVLSILLLSYGGWGAYENDLYIPGKRSSGIHLHDEAAWLMYGAFICAAAVMFSLVVDHYDRRNNQRHYVTFKRLATVAGWVLVAAAMLWRTGVGVRG